MNVLAADRGPTERAARVCARCAACSNRTWHPCKLEIDWYGCLRETAFGPRYLYLYRKCIQTHFYHVPFLDTLYGTLVSVRLKILLTKMLIQRMHNLLHDSVCRRYGDMSELH